MPRLYSPSASLRALNVLSGAQRADDGPRIPNVPFGGPVGPIVPGRGGQPDGGTSSYGGDGCESDRKQCIHDDRGFARCDVTFFERNRNGDCQAYPASYPASHCGASCKDRTSKTGSDDPFGF